MVSLLSEFPFEKITVSELCRRGQTSRITFYTYYEDKYALADEIFTDFLDEAGQDYHRLQAMNNPENDGLAGYENLLECILNLYSSHSDFFTYATPEKNPYLFSVFFNHIFDSVDDYLRRHTKLVPRYSIRETAALLCNGLCGVINICRTEKLPDAEVRRRVRGMYSDILASNLFLQQK